MKKCKLCGQINRRRSLFCSDKCRKKNYRLENRQKIKVYNAKWRLDNKEHLEQYNEKWRQDNKLHIKQKAQEWYQNNKELKRQYKIDNRERIRQYFNNRLKNDKLYKLRHNLRNRLRCALKNNQKTGSAVRDLGCSIAEFKIYLESKWQEGMSWDNYGEWHIDHIKPLSKFNLENKEELKRACHYTNLQPLWAEDNLEKWCH